MSRGRQLPASLIKEKKQTTMGKEIIWENL